MRPGGESPGQERADKKEGQKAGLRGWGQPDGAGPVWRLPRTYETGLLQTGGVRDVCKSQLKMSVGSRK